MRTAIEITGASLRYLPPYSPNLKATVITVDLVLLADSQRALPGVGQLDWEKGAA